MKESAVPACGRDEETRTQVSSSRRSADAVNVVRNGGGHRIVDDCGHV